MARTRTTQAVRRQMTRARLLDAAFSVFAASGYTGATIDAIVHTAGYSKGAFYFHFPAKDDVLKELLIASESEIVTAVGALPKEAPLPVVLSAVGAAMARR